jgi:hypothetical protein
MRRSVAVFVLVLSLLACSDEGDPSVATTTTTTSTTAAAPTTVSCETVAFTPNSEDAASSITATGLDCDEAEAFVRIAGAQTSSGGPREVEVDGYRCVQTSTTEDPLPQAAYECTSGDKTITFVRT